MLNHLSPDTASFSADLAGLADYLRVLAEPRRLLIYNLLRQGVQCNRELGQAISAFLNPGRIQPRLPSCGLQFTPCEEAEMQPSERDVSQ